MRYLRIDNYIIDKPIIDILYEIKRNLTNGKLKSIRPNGDNILVTCPHHANGLEQKPALNIYIGENSSIPYGFVHCFVCDFKGSFEYFVSECFNSTLDYAKQWLITKFGILVEETILVDSPINLNKPKSLFLNEKLLEQYQTWTPYFAKRKLSRQTCENFKLRYDPIHRQAIFPVYDISGHLKMLAKRNIDTKVFYLDKKQEKEVYALNIIQKNNIKKALITEGPFDCLSGWEHEIPTIATLGNISNYQIEQLNKSCLNILYLAFDNDEAGKRFSDIIKRRLTNRIITFDIELPKNRKDLNDLSEEDWQNLIKNYNLAV